jgi:hypothetical protein
MQGGLTLRLLSPSSWLFSSASRLAADLQILIFAFFGLVHVLTCIWFISTDGVTGNYLEISKYNCEQTLLDQADCPCIISADSAYTPCLCYVQTLGRTSTARVVAGRA